MKIYPMSTVQVGANLFRMTLVANGTVAEARSGNFIKNKKFYQNPGDTNDPGKPLAQGSIYINTKTGAGAMYDEENDKFGDEA